MTGEDTDGKATQFRRPDETLAGIEKACELGWAKEKVIVIDEEPISLRYYLQGKERF